MDNAKKRERNVNFSHGDTDKLITLVEKYKGVIENKKSDAVTWKEKERAWKAIEAEYNCSATGVFRDAKHLKIKYEAIKRDTRKKSSAQRSELYKTGGGVNNAPPLTPAEEKVKKMILLSVEGGESTCDSDQVDIGAVDTRRELIVYPEFLTEDTADNVVIPNMTASDTVDEENPPPKSLMDHEDPVPSTSREDDNIEVAEPSPKKWAEWKPSNLRLKKHPALCKPKAKRPFDKLAEEKLELVKLQRTLLEEELQEKHCKKEILEMEKNLRKICLKWK